MPEENKRRTSPRYRIYIPNAFRLITSDGECVADLLDVSSSGVGIAFSDFLCMLTPSPGSTVRLRPLVRMGRELTQDATGTGQPGEMRDSMGASDREQAGEVEARVVWTYLNRMGLAFFDEEGSRLCKHLLERRGTG
jgi:hypothetical protein